MALIGHWPLTGNLNDYSGNNNHLLYINNNSKLIINNNGKIGRCYERVNLQDGADFFRTTNKIFLENDFTIMCWAFVSDTTSSANGLITNHSHGGNTGPGITVRQQSTDDYRISCNTGTGTSRTYNAYYGTSNIKNKWSHLTMRYNSSTESFDLLVNGIIEKTQSYTMKNIEDYFEIFSWSTSYSNSSAYRPASKINDVRVYNELLSLKQIQYLAKAKVLHYTFDNLSSNIVPDISGYNHHGTFINTNFSFTTNTQMKRTVANFNNTTITTEKIFFDTENQKWTAMTWAYVDPNNGQKRCFFNNFNMGNYFILTTSNNKAILYLNSGTNDSYSYSSGAIPIGEWFHISFVLNTDIQRCQIYLNGEEYGKTSNYAATDIPKGFSAITEFGKDFIGSMDDIRIYANDLSQDEIKDIYSQKINLDNFGNIQANVFIEETNKKSFEKTSIVHFVEIDEYSGTENLNVQQEITKTGTLKINGEFSEVD